MCIQNAKVIRVEQRSCTSEKLLFSGILQLKPSREFWTALPIFHSSGNPLGLQHPKWVIKGQSGARNRLSSRTSCRFCVIDVPGGIVFTGHGALKKRSDHPLAMAKDIEGTSQSDLSTGSDQGRNAPHLLLKAPLKQVHGTRGSRLPSPQSLPISARSGGEPGRPILNCNTLESDWSI